MQPQKRNIYSLFSAIDNALKCCQNSLFIGLWVLIPYYALIIVLVLLVYKIYSYQKKRDKLTKDILEYIKTVHTMQKSLELLNEPLNEVSSNAKLDELQRDKIRVSIWRINTMQSTLKALINLEKENNWFQHQIQQEKKGVNQSKGALNDLPPDESEIYTSILGNQNPNDQYFLEKVFSIIRVYYADPSFNVDVLSQEMGMSRSSFYNKIKLISGQAPADFIRQYRMERAKELLKTKQYTISEVAFKSGFTDAKYFRDVFHKKFNRSPSQYAKSNQL
ncbi:MAG: AraC family transcriptional regulator [Bacteroidota bacterium]|nr:AraC family transcriptional regulator [Bacteroidota bacterium]